MTRLFLIGDSHAATYAEAAKSQKMGAEVVGGPLGAANLWFAPFCEVSSSGQLRWTNDVIARNFEKWSKVTGISNLDECRGSLVVSLGLAPAYLYGHRMWMRTVGPRPTLHVSTGLLEDMIQELQSEVLKFYSLAVEREWLHSVIMPPSLQKRHKALKILGHEQIDDLVVQFRRPILDFLGRNKIAVIDVRDQADESGFLRAKYWGDDHSHGNVAYGMLVLDRLLRIEQMSRQEPSPLYVTGKMAS